MNQLTTVRSTANTTAANRGGLIGLGYFLLQYMELKIDWQVVEFFRLVDWRELIYGAIAAYLGTGSIAAYFRDQVAPWKTVEDVPAKAPQKPVERVTHRIEPSIDDEVDVVLEPAKRQWTWHYSSLAPYIHDEIMDDEGEVLRTYLDTLGNKTGGIGHLITPDDEPYYSADVGMPIPAKQSARWFDEDLTKAIVACQHHFTADMPKEVKLVLVNMCFQLGANGLFGANGFTNTLQYIRHRNWNDAADEMMDSKWAKQTPARAKRLSDRIRALAAPVVPEPA